jgi:acyl carrier protein
MTAADVDGWDSLTHVRLMLSVERAFATKFTASEIGRLKTVGDLVELIARKTS